jgi:FkbM family methyltransferase
MKVIDILKSKLGRVMKRVLARLFYLALDISSIFGYSISIKRNSVHPEMQGAKFDEAYLQKIAICLNKTINFIPKNIVEVGANLAQDSRFLANHWAIPESEVYVFEPISEYANLIKVKYQMNVFAIAVSNIDGQTELNLPDSPNNNLGFASILKREFTDTHFRVVQTIRLDTWMKEQRISKIDFLKIDAEGLSWEVLQGLGSRIRQVNVIQLETETIEIWKSQNLEDSIFSFLKEHDFRLLDYCITQNPLQADSLWVNKKVMTGLRFELSPGEFISLN